MGRRQDRQRRMAEEEKKVNKKSKGKLIFGWIFQTVVIILLAYILVFFFGQSRTNIGQSMDSTLAGGDKVLLNDVIYRISSPSRFDVIAFKPNGSNNSHSYIKRVIGMPGETIQIKDGMIYINDEILLEQKDYPAISDAGLASVPITLGDDEYFVLGDNRSNSEDSRFADVGNVKSEYIEGKVWFVYSPTKHLGLVK